MTGKSNYIIVAYMCAQAMLIMSLASCRSDRNKAVDEGEYLGDSSMTGILEEIDQARKIFYLTPSPAEMLDMMDVKGTSFDRALPNDAKFIDRYFDLRSQSLNLGVYITDMAYMALYGRHDETIEYLEAIDDLAGKARVKDAFSNELINRARKNTESLDSLYLVSNEAFVNLVSYCEQNKRSNTAVLVSAGALIESLYMAVAMVEDYYEANYLIQHIADQKYVVENLFKFAEGLSADPNVARLLEELEPVRKLYGSVNESGNNTTVKKEETGRLVIGSNKKLGLSGEQFGELKRITMQIRNGIVNNTI